MREFDVRSVKELLPYPAADANKYTRGRLLLVGGSEDYPGAACLAAAAAQRMGAGYTQVVCAPESVPVLRAWRPSLVVRPWDAWQPQDEPASTPARPWACAVGCGFDPDDLVRAGLVIEVLRETQAPVLVDGGGISSLASLAGIEAARERKQQGLATVVTPHAGEAARMARAARIDEGLSASGLCAELACAYCSVVVLKGPVTYVSDGEGVTTLSGGTAALAKAGTGDVLAGMVGALLSQGMLAPDAGVLGVMLHSLAGAAAASELTAVSVIPEDVVERIPQAIQRLESL